MNNLSILISGNTDAFCKKFIDTVLNNYNPNTIIVYSRDKLKQFDMQQICPYDYMMLLFI